MGRIYYQNIKVTDWGPYVNKVILGMPSEVKREQLSTDDFHAYVEIYDKSGNIVKLPKDFLHRDELVESKGDRVILDVYPSDMNGTSKLETSNFVTLEMAYGPIYPCSSAIASDFSNMNGHGKYIVSDYTITWKSDAGEILFDKCGGVFNPEADAFKTGCSGHKDIPLSYGYYLPELHGGKKPLIVFLHGAGEGGYDIPIAYTGNKVTALVSDYVQNLFGGAIVLVPQCPTMWLDDGSHQYGTTGVTMYGEALKFLIDEFIEKYSDVIDTNRIFVGGDSNGGFMTMRMLVDYPAFFAGAFPICEALIDSVITDADIENLKKIPIWFTHAKNDPVVRPEDYVVPTYERLMKAGAKDVHFTFWDKIVDLHGEFLDEKGEPFEYLGHFSWVHVFNDDCKVDYDGQPVVVDGKEVTLLEWLSKINA